jgi:predicted dinucleotide-binding enzyme
MKIAIIGAKNVGSVLARKWAAAGHQVTLGVRNVNNPNVVSLAKSLSCSVKSVGEAIGDGEVVVFAIPGNAMDDTLQMYGTLLDKKIVIDAANRIGGATMNSAESFAKNAPGAALFRAFNSLGWENFENPQFGHLKADLFYCGGDDGEGKSVVESLISDVGLNPLWLGDLSQIHLVDMVGALWFNLVFGQHKGRNLAFKVLTR